jgi:hypothetical protein
MQVLYVLKPVDRITWSDRPTFLAALKRRYAQRLCESDPRDLPNSRFSRNAVVREVHELVDRGFGECSDEQLRRIEALPWTNQDPDSIKSTGLLHGDVTDETSALYYKYVMISLAHVRLMAQSKNASARFTGRAILQQLADTGLASAPDGYMVMVHHIGRFAGGFAYRYRSERRAEVPIQAGGDRAWEEAVAYAGGKRAIRFLLVEDLTLLTGRSWCKRYVSLPAAIERTELTDSRGGNSSGPSFSITRTNPTPAIPARPHRALRCFREKTADLAVLCTTLRG